ncbi:MAG TPA: IPT/TIG domain-containing protein [Blastocatellia bacterium]|nr:IPT/TIG domain-containing protein [Blastocatellia bacterium]
MRHVSKDLMISPRFTSKTKVLGILGLCLLACVVIASGSVFISSSAAKTNLLSNVYSPLPSASQGAEPEQEPNETQAQANPISTPGQKTGSAKFGDAAQFEYIYSNDQKDKIEDVFTFTVPANQTMKLDITLTFNNSAADLDLFLFKSELSQIGAIAVSNGSSTTERIPSTQTLNAGTYFIGVSAFDGNTASTSYVLSATPNAPAPPPTISSISPQSVTAGGGPFSITVNGANFLTGQPRSIVKWNGQNRSTTVTSSTQLVAFLSAADIASPGTNFVTVVNPPELGGTSAAAPFVVLTAGSPEPEVEPNETSEQATLLRAPGRRGGMVSVGDAALITVNINNGSSDPVEDIYGLTLPSQSRLDLLLMGSNPVSNLALYLMREVSGTLNVIGSSRFGGPFQRVTTANTLAAGRYLVGVSAMSQSSPYTIESSRPFEADVSPRTLGSGAGSTTIADWTQVGRFVFGIDTPVDSSEFQRADCAPKDTLGDGRLTLADWVMAGRYVAGLEAPAVAGGPSVAAPSLVAVDKGIDEPYAKRLVENEQQQTRTVRVIPVTFNRGQSNTLTVELNSLGNENALGFSLNFDATQMTFVSATLGPDGVPGTSLQINSMQAAQGRLGVGLALPSGQAFQAGARRILVVAFNVPQTSSVNSTTVSFGNVPIPRETVDSAANDLPTTYVPGVITLNPPVATTPVLASLNPNTVIVGGPAFSLTITGSNFVNGVVARANGVDRATQFNSPTEVVAMILAQDIAAVGSISITVRSADPNAPISNALDLQIVNPVPTLTSISPNQLPVGSSAFTLQLTGTNFVPGAVVQWNGANRVTFPPTGGGTQLTATIPASDLLTAGTATVRVVNPTPGGGPSNTVNFTIATPNPIPRITTINPTTIQAGSPDFDLIVTGSGFVNSSVVRINGNNLPTTFNSATQLTARITSANIPNPGNATITVFTPAPGGGTSNAAILQVTPPPNPTPAIMALSPNPVLAGSGQFTLAVTGTNFIQNSVVRFNGQDRQTVFVSTSEVRATITANDILNGGSAQITVFNPPPVGGTSNALTLMINFAPPVITFVSPTSAVAGGPAFQLQVLGTNFAPGSVVRWNGQDRMTTQTSVTELSAQITAADIANVGSAQVTVFSPPPGAGLSNAFSFNITQAARPIPRLTAISPDNAEAGGPAFTLTVTGQNFVSDSVVRWNNSDRPTTFVSSTQLTAAIPPADIANVGNALITVFTPPAGGGVSNALTFAITTPPNPLPTVTTINPSTVNAGGPAFTLTVNGTGFVSSSVVQLNGANRATTFVNAGQLTAQINAEDIAASGEAMIRVVSPPPGGGTSNVVILTIVNPVPTLTSIDPNLVEAGTGAFQLTANGTNFVLGAQILINNNSRPTTFVNSTQLKATVPASEIANPATLNVQVVNPGPGGGASNTLPLEVRNRNPVPRITSLNPDTVSAGGPAFVLVVTGSAFVQGSVGRVNGQDRQTDFVSATSLAVQIPATDIATAGTLTITIFNPALGGGTSNSAALTVNNPAPQITSISPDTAPAGSPEITLVVNGAGFVQASVVRFATFALQTTFVTNSQLTAVIPAGLVTAGASVPITVVNPAPGGGTSNPVTFTITNPSPTITSLSPDQVLAAGPQFALTVNGSGFVNGSIVRINGQERQTAFNSGTQLTATVLAADIAAGGGLSVTVFNPAPGGGVSNALTLSVINPVPTISGFNPSAIAAGSAAFTLKVLGNGFVPGSVVNWNGSPRTTTFDNSGQVSAQITAADVATAGSASITVVNPAPGGGTSNTLSFTISAQPNPVPTLTSLNPNSIPAGSAAFILTVNGTNFVPGAVVNWNGSPRVTTFVNNTQVTAQILASDVAAQGSASVIVVNPAPGGGASNALILTITPPNPVPVLTKLTPDTAAVGGPAFNLTVNGSSFVNGAVVNWNGSPRPTTFTSATELVAQIPATDIASVGVASVTVVNPAPGGGVSNALPFTISDQPNPVPAITALNPSSAFVGDDPFTLAVTGSGFIAGSVVQWNGSARPTTVVSATELRADIPSTDLQTAGDVQITVFNPAPGGGLSNALIFTVNALQCQLICIQSPQFFSLNTSKLPRGYIHIGGVNFNNPVLVQSFILDVRRALQGGTSPLQMLNQQYVAAQLSLLVSAGPFGASGSAGVQNTSLRCYGLNFAPIQLSNGFTISRNTTFGEMLSQSRSAIIANRTDDMTKLAMVLALLNGNDPTNRCQ